MSDIQEEQKRLYKRAEENDIELLQEENNRLNNIIDELDKWLDEESEKTILSTGHLTCLMMCKNKLNELKGDNK